MSGYSATTLIKKLGIKPDSKILFINEPASIYGKLATMPKIDGKVDSQDFDYIHFFTKDRNDLELFFGQVKKVLKRGGALWISWPKKSSKLKSDVSENVVRQIGLESGLVDVKVVSIDDVWSGLKFVYRIVDR